VNASSREIPVLRFESLDSTNEEALRQLAGGASLPFWIVANEQREGRGRNGRHWISQKGNLYATLVIETGVSPATATQLSFVAGLAAHDATAMHLPTERIPALRLKWPNDVMLGGAKLAGVLLESLRRPKGEGLAVILGVGVNVSHAPANVERATTSLGLDAAAVPKVFASLARAFETRLALWDEGRRFPRIREAWLSRAMALNESISVNLNGSAIRGKFRGVDPAGALQLETEPGVVITVTAGDIYPDTLG
jgi:BirA family transcriptional regulator, biotin operon repressor / biotin---[acetyl-CoA-carboxylase] ligase